MEFSGCDRDRKRYYDKKYGGKKNDNTKPCGPRKDCPFCYPAGFKRLDYEFEMKRILKYNGDYEPKL